MKLEDLKGTKVVYSIDDTIHLPNHDNVNVISEAFAQNRVSSVRVLDDNNEVIYAWVRSIP